MAEHKVSAACHDRDVTLLVLKHAIYSSRSTNPFWIRPFSKLFSPDTLINSQLASYGGRFHSTEIGPGLIYQTVRVG